MKYILLGFLVIAALPFGCVGFVAHFCWTGISDGWLIGKNVMNWVTG